MWSWLGPILSVLLSPRDIFWERSLANSDSFCDSWTYSSRQDCYFVLDIPKYLPRYKETVPSSKSVFALLFSKPGKFESSEWFRYASHSPVRLGRSAFRCWHSTLPSVSYRRFVRAKIKCSTNMQSRKTSVRCKIKSLLLSPTDKWSVYPLLKRFPAISLLLPNPSDDLPCGLHEKSVVLLPDLFSVPFYPSFVHLQPFRPSSYWH